MASESVTLQAVLQLTATEVRSTSDVPSASSDPDRTVVHNEFNYAGRMTGSTTQDVDRVVYQQVSIGTGTTTIDLSSAPTVNGTEDMTGKKVVATLLESASGNSGAATVAPGATNPYPLFGSGNSVDVEVGETIAKTYRNVATSHPAVAASVKEIDISGTNGDTLNVLFVLGD